MQTKEKQMKLFKARYAKCWEVWVSDETTCYVKCTVLDDGCASVIFVYPNSPIGTIIEALQLIRDTDINDNSKFAYIGR